MAPAVVDEAGGHCEEPVAYCGRDGESVGGVDGAEAAVSRTMLCPSAAQAGPGAVGEEPPRGAASGPVVFEVSDGGLHSGVAAVLGVGGFGVEVVSVSDERVVAPVGPQLGLGADEAGAVHHQAQLAALAGAAARAGGLNDLRLPAAAIGDRSPVVVVYGPDGCFDPGVVGHGDRVARLVCFDRVEHRTGEEPRVGANGSTPAEEPDRSRSAS